MPRSENIWSSLNGLRRVVAFAFVTREREEEGGGAGCAKHTPAHGRACFLLGVFFSAGFDAIGHTLQIADVVLFYL